MNKPLRGDPWRPKAMATSCKAEPFGADGEHPDLPTRRSEQDRGKKAGSDPAAEWGGTAQLAMAAGGVATRRRGDSNEE